MSEDRGESARNWIDEAEDALSRTGEALRTAWSETKEGRMATMEAAREAAARLGKAIDLGIETVRATWDSSQHDEDTPLKPSAEDVAAMASTTADNADDDEEE